MREYVKKGCLNLQINSVVEGEVRNHIKEKVINDVNKIRSDIKNSINLAGFRCIQDDGVKVYNKKFACLNVPGDEIWIEDAIQRFDMLLDSLAVERITVEGISINDMLDDYFQKKLPFETRKPNEFKDAILIRSVLLEIERLYKEDFDNKERGKFTWQENIDKLQYLIVSGDKGVSAAFDDEVAVRFNKDVIIFEKITNLLNYIAKQERIVNMLDELLLHNYGINEIEESIRVAVESADIDIECYEGSIEEIDIETVEIEDISTNVISIKELSDGRLVSTVYVYAEVMIYLTVSYIDYDKSFWDKETKSYMWKTIDRKQAQYSTYIDSIIQLDVTDIQDILKDENIDTTTSEGQDELNEWSGKGTVVKDMYDFPNNIYLYEDDMVSSEIIDSRDVYE